MRKIVISGSRSNIGKTLLAEKMLHSLTDWAALKVTVSRQGELRCPRRHGRCRVCSEIKGDFEIIKDKKIINQKGTDTSRLKKAGAKKVIWLKATLGGLKEGLRKSLLELEDAKGLIIEGTSVLRKIKPDFTIYMRDKTTHLKKSAKEAERKADIIINVDK
ncbi:MAG: hypothetical protein NG712_00290 [Omnitrophica bacterium]|nr:hypothetical protein [Candidatus Omnitrophota bacterium]